MIDVMDRTLPEVAFALRRKEVSATDLVEEAIRRHVATDSSGRAYKLFDEEGARESARVADRRLAADPEPPPFCGIPVSVKDLYGVAGLPTFAGTVRHLPKRWEADGWLVRRLREQHAVFMGKTHTVELAYGAVGINPHWDTPRNPWDAEADRIPGGSSCGAGVSLWARSALLALGSDTGGSIRIPAAMTGTVGHKITQGRWPTTGVVPLSSTLDTVGALSRSVADSEFFFGAIDPAHGDPQAFRAQQSPSGAGTANGRGPRIAIPHCAIWTDCQPDVGDVLTAALDELGVSGWSRSETDGRLLDAARDLYMTGGIVAAECVAFLQRELPGWRELLHPMVGGRLAGAPAIESAQYADALVVRRTMMDRTAALFGDADLLALPAAMITPPISASLDAMEAYIQANATALRPTCPISMLGLCAISILGALYQRQGSGTLLFSRFIPVISFNLINYAAGLTNVSWWTFTWATGLGILPLTFLMVLFGDRMWSGEAEIWIWIFVAGLVGWLAWIVAMRYRQRSSR